TVLEVGGVGAVEVLHDASRSAVELQRLGRIPADPYQAHGPQRARQGPAGITVVPIGGGHLLGESQRDPVVLDRSRGVAEIWVVGRRQEIAEGLVQAMQVVLVLESSV